MSMTGLGLMTDEEQAEFQASVKVLTCFHGAQLAKITTPAEMETMLASLQELLNGDIRALGHATHSTLMVFFYQAVVQLYAMKEEPGVVFDKCTPETVAHAQAHAQGVLKAYKERVLQDYAD
jgi:hypothetical protein